MRALATQISRLGLAMADFLFPRICCGCDRRIVEYGRIVCADCEKSVEALEPPICEICGHPDARMRSAERCEACPSGEIHFAAARATTVFSGVARTVIQQLKYDSRPEYAPFMAARMAAQFPSEFATRGIQMLVPVPLFHARERQRGFNQSRLLATELSRILSIPVEDRALRRKRATPSQTRLTREQRAENIRGAFEVVRSEALAGRQILLIDDVFTTGATLNECAGVLRAAGAGTVCCFTYAKAIT